MNICGRAYDGPRRDRVLNVDHSAAVSGYFEVNNDLNVPQDNNNPDPDRAGLGFRAYAPPTGLVPDSPCFGSYGEFELPNLRRFSLRRDEDIIGRCAVRTVSNFTGSRPSFRVRKPGCEPAEFNDRRLV